MDEREVGMASQELPDTLRAWLLEEAPMTVPSELRQSVLSATAAMGQRSRWLPVGRPRASRRDVWLVAGGVAIGVVALVASLALLGKDPAANVGSSPSASPSAAAGPTTGAWTEGAGAPFEPGPMFVGVAGGSMLALVAEEASSRSAARLLAYDPSADRWTDRGRIDERVGIRQLSLIHSSVVTGDTIFLIGYDASTPVPELISWPIDLATRRGTSGSEPPGYGSHRVVAGHDGRIYVLETSGSDQEQEPQALRIYDPLSDRWTDASPLLSKRAESFVVSDPTGGIYVLGGTTVPSWTSETESTAEPLHTIERYDPSTDTWSEFIDAPPIDGGLAAATFAADGALYVMWLHVDASAGMEVRLDRFDPTRAAWTRLEAPIVSPQAMLGTDDGRLVVFGGRPYTFNDVIFEAGYQQPSVTWIRDLPVP